MNYREQGSCVVRWDYKYIQTMESAEDFMEMVWKAGADGWEMVNFAHIYPGSGYAQRWSAVFKRMVP